MISKECRTTRLNIEELALGEQPSEDATAHLNSCAPCREFQLERAELRELVGSLEAVVAPADFDMRLRARIAAERNSDRQPFTFARLFGTPALTAAALFVAVAGSLVWIAQRGTPIAPSGVTQNTPGVSGPDTTTGPDKVVAKPTEGDETSKPESDQLAAVTQRRRPGNRSSGRDYARSVRQPDQAFVPSRPVVLGLEDEGGTTQRISVPPVTFGAQSLVDNRVPVSYSGRVW